MLAPGKSRWGGAGENVLGYRCRGVHTAGVCSQPASINARKLEAYVETLWREQMAQELLSVQEGTLAFQTAADALSEAEDELAAADNGSARARGVRRDSSAPTHWCVP